MSRELVDEFMSRHPVAMQACATVIALVLVACGVAGLAIVARPQAWAAACGMAFSAAAVILFGLALRRRRGKS